MSFWDKAGNQVTIDPNQSPAGSTQVVYDEEEVSMVLEDPNTDIFEEDEELTSEVMHDANLRLEMGRLWQMILQNNIFADTNADPKAIRNVQREIRKHARDRMETMLGMRLEEPKHQTVVSSPFNDMEVTALKMIASKVTKGASESQQPTPSVSAPAPKKDGITAISGNLRSDGRPAALPPSSNGQTNYKPQPKAKPTKSALKPQEESLLKKPIEEMTAEELQAHDAAALARLAKNKSALPQNLVPHPTPQALEMMYAATAANTTVANPPGRFRPY